MNNLQSLVTRLNSLSIKLSRQVVNITPQVNSSLSKLSIDDKLGYYTTISREMSHQLDNLVSITRRDKHGK